MNIREKIIGDMPDLIQTDVSLSPFNTFKFSYQAQYFALVEDVVSLKAVIAWAKPREMPITIIGGGSNLLIRNDISGLVIVNRLQGKQLVRDEGDNLILSVSAGENWHHLVDYTVHKGWFGLENLALIPGTVGAAPVQNIGAYGVEAKDVLERIQVLDLISGQLLWLFAKDCGFAYRDSHFKGKWKGRYIITAVEIRLSRSPQFILSYGGLKGKIEGELTLESVFEAVCSLRRSKLPDPNIIANAGSFFKNPIVSVEKHDQLKLIFPELVSFSFAGGYKLAAGWMIDQAGWKGIRHQGVGVYEHQALVLVNYSENQAPPLLELEALIKQSVFDRYGVWLEREPVELPDAFNVTSSDAEAFS